MATTKDANKYALHMEYDAKKEDGTVVFVKNGRIVTFEELPEAEQQVYMCMVAEVVDKIFPKTEGEGESESSQEQP